MSRSIRSIRVIRVHLSTRVRLSIRVIGVIGAGAHHRQEVRHQGCARRTRGAMKHFFGLGQNESRVEEQDPCVSDLNKCHVIAEWWADLVDK